MAYSEKLADRIRSVLKGTRSVEERKMFGGLCYMVRGHMCVGIVKDELMVRVGPNRYDTLVTKPHAREMDFTGRALRGMVYVAADGIRTRKQLETWVERGVAFVKTLPAR